jgi:adenylate kinase
MSNGKLIIVTGLTGVGKTSVINKAINEHGTPTGKNIKHRSYGTILLNEGKQQGIIENRDEITDLEPDTYDELQEFTANRIAELGETMTNSENDPVVVIDTHATLNTPTGYRAGFTKRDLNTINPDQFVYITADGEEIRARRENDDTRDRDLPSVTLINEQDTISLQTVTTFSVETRAPVKVIHNHDGELNQSSEKLNSLF